MKIQKGFCRHEDFCLLFYIKNRQTASTVPKREVLETIKQK